MKAPVRAPRGRPRVLLSAALSLLCSGPLTAFDWGAQIEAGGSVLQAAEPAYGSDSVVRLWVSQPFSRTLSLTGALAARNTLRLKAPEGSFVSNTLSLNLESLILSGEGFWIGRSELREFSSQVLATRLDGAQVNLRFPPFDVRLGLGTSASLFKSDSTIVLSEEDLEDRTVDEDFSRPETLWAPPRLVGVLDAGWRLEGTDLMVRTALLGQADLRPGAPADGAMADVRTLEREGAALHTAYGGLGLEGRLFGPLFWSLRGFALGGQSLTMAGPLVESKGQQTQVWKTSYLLGGLGTANLSWVQPQLSGLVADLGLRLGSGDPDGAAPDANRPVSLNSLEPSLFTGWIPLSRTGGALIFNPQQGNLATAQLTLSLRPHPALQVVSATWAHARVLPAAISEPGLRPGSQELYLGTESNLTLLWRPLSDLGLSLAAGGFWPSELAMTRSPEFRGQASLTLSF